MSPCLVSVPFTQGQLCLSGWLTQGCSMDAVEETYWGEWNKAPGKWKGTINQDLVLYLISKEFLALKAADGLLCAHCLDHLSRLCGCSTVPDFYKENTIRNKSIVFAPTHLFPWKLIDRLCAKQSSAKIATVTILAREGGGGGWGWEVKLPRKKRKHFPLHCSSASLVKNQMHKTQWTPASWQNKRGNCCAQLINASCLRTKILPHPANCGACPLGTEDPVHLSTCAGCTLGKGRGRL